MTALINQTKAFVMLVTILALASCSATYRNHGYVPTEDDMAELIVGVDTRATVDDVIGAPSASGVLSDGDYYYVRSRVRNFGPTRPKVIERQVVAISFDDTDTIANIERFGLEDGRVVPLERRVTNSSVQDKGFLRQLFGNIGGLNLGNAFGNN